MTEEQMAAEMARPKGAALTLVEWFILLTFFKKLGELEEEKILDFFSSRQDFDAVMGLVTRIKDQVFPYTEEEGDPADLLMFRPKIIT